MRRRLHLILILSILIILKNPSLCAQYQLIFRDSCLSGKDIKLAYYFGKSLLLKETIRLDNTGNARSGALNHEGMFELIFPDSSRYGFLVTAPGDYSIEANSEGYVMHSNPTSEAFALFLQSSQYANLRIDSLRELNTAGEDVQNITREIRFSLDSNLLVWSILYQGTLAGSYFRALIPVKVPDSISADVRLPDSARWIQSLQYYRDHFLDPVEWDAPGMAYTPVPEDMAETYFFKVLPREAERHCLAIDELMRKITNAEMRELIQKMLIRNYRSSLHDPVYEYAYVYLAEHFILHNKPGWVTPALEGRIQAELEELKPSLLGNRAPEIILPDMNQQLKSLYSIQADAIVILFWDYACPACQRIIDDFRSVISNFDYKNVAVYTVFLGEDSDIRDAWTVKRLSPSWTNVTADDNREVIRNYHIEKTPALFLLDPDHRITGKNFTVKELEKFLLTLPY